MWGKNINSQYKMKNRDSWNYFQLAENFLSVNLCFQRVIAIFVKIGLMLIKPLLIKNTNINLDTFTFIISSGIIEYLKQIT